MIRSVMLLLILASAPAFATDPQVKHVTQGYPGACQANAADAAKIVIDELGGRAVATAKVFCSPPIDSSQNGANAFGLTLTNATASTLTLSCTAKISTAKPGPHVYVARTVMISPRAHGAFKWASADVGEGKTFRGGQVGISCVLPAGVSLSNVWTQSVGN